MEINLLEKTELRINRVELRQANLTDVAAKVASVLNLPRSEVLVVDVRSDHICLDILARTIDIRQVIGKEKILLDELRTVDGVVLQDNAYVDSSGILGVIGCKENEAAEIISRTAIVGSSLERGVLRRAIVFATGFEIEQKMIKDTNSPHLLAMLTRQGYTAQFGGVVGDDVNVITRKLQEAAEQWFGLVITTGGVGAEDKDYSIEALTRLDSKAATPWIVKFQKGVGRHVKEGVRIGVGQCGWTTFVNLPGPHDEVIASSSAITKHCNTGPIDKVALANDIAEVLREKLRCKNGGGFHH